MKPNNTTEQHSQYLERCFQLAKLGETYAFPNPIVGCVIVHNNQVIGEGFHKNYGGPHAEVNAINSTLTALQPYSPTALKQILKESTIYINLEPCSHTGKTPPCADLIIKHKFKKLVFSSYDPNPQVNSIEKIRAAGIEVIEPKDLDPELVQESDYLNRVFFKSIKEPKSAWVTVKIATTSDGRMITDPNEPRWITNSESRKDVHRLRSCNDLLITSIRTVEADNPEYTVRHSAEELGLAAIKNPDIAILKSSTDFSHRDYKIFKDSSRKVSEYKVSPLEPYSPTTLQPVLKEFIDMGYKRIMIEAGPKLSQTFIESGLVDEIVHYQAGKNETNYQGFRLISSKKISATNEPVNTKRYFINTGL